ncbi:MAG: hypothetical protein GTN97_00395 [Nitrosopumilaceae archaeon]|nr:hypothetical protein [Nitrosopumilaceae archaeon]NIP10254.1 hypothetical protein [Nitrosopumilaceae archaeon]NIS94397.1 hypothetical protein [Nitrosopumilaceae archaeon]
MIANQEEFYSLYNSIMNLDAKVRFVTILDKSGEVLFGGQREGIENYLSEEDQKKSIKHVTDAWFSRNQFSSGIGEGKYAMAEYGKVKRFTFPLKTGQIIYITTEPSLDQSSFIQSVLKIKESH